MEVDALVVGGGPGGLAAALWLARFRRSVVVADSGEYRAARVERSHGYLGRDPQEPMELLARGREELVAYPTARLVRAAVSSVRRSPDGMFDTTLGGDLVRAHRLVLACGVVDTLPEVRGIDTHYGASAAHCPACDGYEVRDCDVVALGWDERLVGFASTLLHWARSVTVVTDGHRFDGDARARADLADQGIELVEERAAELLGPRGDLQGVRLASGRVLPASQLFFSVAHQPRTGLATELGCALDEEGYVTVDECGRTSVDGVYAAGDLTPGLQLVAVAAAKGTAAGVACAQSMPHPAGALDAPDPAPDRQV